MILFYFDLVLCWLFTIFHLTDAFLDPYEKNAKIYVEDGHLTIESGHNKDILFKSNFGQIKLNGLDLSDLTHLINQKSNSLDQISNRFLNSKSADDFNLKFKKFDTLESEVKYLNQNLSSMLNNYQVEPSAFYKTLINFHKLKKQFEKFLALVTKNECLSDPCKNGATCLDSFATYNCLCTEGWTGKNCNQDINECQLFSKTNLGCQNNSKCLNKPGSFECICPPEYQGKLCTIKSTSSSLICNEASSFELCVHGRCKPNLKFNNSTSNNITYTCICEPGWKSAEDNPACTEDINECELHQELVEEILKKKLSNQIEVSKSVCSIKPPVACYNTLGSFRCDLCPPGYTGNGQICVDINECEFNNGGCSKNPLVDCLNLEGSFSCGPCPPNYSGDGFTCVVDYVNTDFIISNNEQKLEKICQKNPCLNQGICYLTNNSTTNLDSKGKFKENKFFCECSVGFLGKYCEIKINYCKIYIENPCKNNGTCISSKGHYSCTCKPEWTGNNCEKPNDLCGGYFQEKSGSIVFPQNDTFTSYYTKYGFYCEWIIELIDNKKIELEVVYVKINDYNDCSSNYLSFSDKYLSENYSNEIVTFCQTYNSLTPKRVTTNYNYVKIVYHLKENLFFENNKNFEFGFEIHWQSKDAVCGKKIVDQKHGSISSPGYPVEYPLQSDCYWTIEVNLNKRIQIYFASISIMDNNYCISNFVEIFDGQTENDMSLGKYCNNTIPAPMVSSGPFVLIHFKTDKFETDKGFHLTFNTVPKIQNCGGILTNDKDIISSPHFPIKYDNNLECDYLIRLKNPNDRIQLKFNYIDLEKHHNCTFDYVEIFDGPNEFSPKIGRFCSKTFTNKILISSENKIFIKFKSDKNVHGDGFILSYEVFCGGLFTDLNGEIFSPGYPESYPSNKNCQYVIQLPFNYLIKLKFITFDLEYSKQCLTDSLTISENNSNRTQLKKYCGSTSPDIFISEYNELSLKLITGNKLNEHKGFYIQYKSIFVNCGGILKDSPGFFSSPSFPGSNNSNSSCNWIIKAPQNQIIKLTFATFSIEKRAQCDLGFVQILDVNSNSYGKFCGNEIPSPIQTNENEIIVKYFLANTVNSPGFSANYIFVDKTSVCGGVLTVDSGIITSPGYFESDHYKPNLMCVWKIIAPIGRQIRLSFLNMSIESNHCDFDYLEVRNGPETTSPLMAKLCGDIIPPEIISHSNQMILIFVSDGEKESKGFKLKYDTALRGCGGLITSPSGSISSPNYPNSYTYNAECNYLISISQGSRINLNFVELDIEDQINCPFDYVEIFNGKDEFAPKIGKFCNSNNDIGLIVSSSNTIFVRFRSNSSIGKKGFVLNYSTNCTNELIGYRGVIESLNYPNRYLSTFDCKWKINVPSGNQIKIVFTDLQLSNNQNCSNTLFLINEIINNKSYKNLTRKICKTKEGFMNFNTTSNTIEITFKKINHAENHEYNHKFRLEYYLIGCGGEFLYKSKGLIQTPNYPNIHKEKLDCIWHIYTNIGNKINLQILDFDIKTGSKCIYGFVKIFGGSTVDSPEIGRICERSGDFLKISSSGNSMTILLKNELSLGGRGFSANFYIEKNTGCGGHFSLDEGYITSPNYPSLYDSNDDCFYSVETSQIKQIKLTILYLDLAYDKNCTGTQLIFYDGNTILNPVLKKECGERKILEENIDDKSNIIKSTSNRMLIRLKANGHNVAKGFKIKYELVCGGILNLTSISHFILKSPNYPYLPKQNKECEWLVQTNLDKKLAITITQLNSYKEINCNTYNLQFYAGNTIDSPFLNKYCNHIPSTFITPGNTLLIRSIKIVFRLIIDTEINSCGGEIMVSKSGEFISPEFPKNYPMNTQCDWILTSGYGNRIKIEFLNFDLQESPFCNLDYLEIRDNSHEGELIGRYCGSTIPFIDNKYLHTLTNSSNSYEIGFNRLWIRFKSDKFGSSSGFRIKYNLLNIVYLNQTSGKISSPLYPLSSCSSEFRLWHISVPKDYVISIKFLKMELDVLRETLCISYVEIYDGSYVLYSKLIKKVCGFDSVKEEIVSNGNEILINYYNNENSLFLLEYKSIKKIEAGEQDFNESNLFNKTKCEKNMFIDSNNQNYEIISPGYPNLYIENLNCVWNIKTFVGYKFLIKIEDLNIEEFDDFCIYDKLEFYDLNDKGKLFLSKTICGKKSNFTLNSNSNIIKFEFRTDSIGKGTGFKISLSTTCGGYLVGNKTGLLMFKTQVGDNLRCNWIINIKSKRKMLLKFNSIKFNLRENQNCDQTFVAVRDGPSFDSPLIGKYCGKPDEKTTNIETTSNQAYITFYVFHSTYQSFELYYDEIRTGCSQKYNLFYPDQVITIKSPNYPNPPPIIECDWIFTSPPSTSLRIDFKLPNSNIPCNFSEQSISIFNGGSIYSPLIVRDCPRISSVRTTENMMYVNYVTNGENLHAAFMANIQISVCGGTYIISQKVILKSKNFPKNYPNNLNCKYYFQSYLPHYNLQFVITKLDLNNNVLRESNNFDQTIFNIQKKNYITSKVNEKCDLAGDFLEFRDEDEEGDIFAKLCSSSLNVTYLFKSPSEKAFILFKTDAMNTGTGFRIEIFFSKQKCGHTLESITIGTIKSPNYPKPLNSIRNCEWILIADKNNRIEIKFKKINLKSTFKNSSECIDELNFYSKPKALNRNFIKPININNQCHFNVNQKIVSMFNIMIITFKTFGLGTNEGFELEYYATKESLCGGVLSEQTGTIQISNQIEYEHEQDNLEVLFSKSCLWYFDFNLINQNVTLSLQIDELNLIEPVNKYFKKSINELSFNQNVVKYSLMTKKYGLNENLCNDSYIYFGKIQVQTINSFYLPLELCGNLTGRNMFYLFPPPYYLNPVIFAHLSNENVEQNIKLAYKINQCGGYYTKIGTFTTPNYPDHYSPNTFCYWKIVVSFATKLILNFNDFDLEENCEEDYVEISSGQRLLFSTFIGKYCGKQKLENITILGDSLLVIFRSNQIGTAKGFNFTVEKIEDTSNCNYLIDIHLYKESIINSPNYPNSYDNNLNCTWTINYEANYHVKIEFLSRFDLENSPNCENDFVLIEQNINDQWKFLAKYCGINKPNTTISKSNLIRVKFQTNSKVTGDGFQLILNKECGQILTSDEGIIQTPNYPDNFDTKLKCDYIIKKNPKDLIYIELKDFDLEDCPNDYLMISKDNSTINLPHLNTDQDSVLNSDNKIEKNELILGPFCGSTKPPNFITNLQFLQLTFVSDSERTSKGFRFIYKTFECGQDIKNATFGQIKSPNYDDDTYLSKLNCVWNIEVEPNYAITLRFQYLDIEYCGTFCYCDYVEMRDESNETSSLLAKLCGQRKGLLVKSTGNRISIKFYSDYSGKGKGFKLTYAKTISTHFGCGGQIFLNETTEGYITSPDIKKSGFYEPNLDCFWILTVNNDNYAIRLTFEKFDLEDVDPMSKKCSDYLQVNDGPSSFQPMIDVFCGHKIPNSIQSSSNKLFLHFSTDSGNQFKGFKIKYQVLQSKCGGSIQVPDNDNFNKVKNVNKDIKIFSLNYPNNYPNNIRCKWIVTIPWFNKIQLDILEFNLNCSNNDYLQLSAEKTYDNLLFRLCSHKDYMNRKRLYFFNNFWIIFNSGFKPLENNLLTTNLTLSKSTHLNQEAKFKFKISLKALTCNLTYEEDSGFIVSPKYPAAWPVKEMEICDFTIKTQLGRTISVYFTEFSVGNKKNCKFNRMQIRDVSSESSKVLANLCGLELPNPIFSTSNQLNFKVFTTNSYSKYYLHYTTTDQSTGCGGNLTSFNGTFTSPLYPQVYNNSKQCVWIIHSLGQHSLNIHFNAFDFKSNSNCESNYLEMYDGNQMLESTFIRKMCGKQIPSDYTSTNNFMIFRMVTNANNTGTGFKISYNINSLDHKSQNQIFVANQDTYLPKKAMPFLVGT